MRFRSLAASHDWPLVDMIRRPLQAIQDTSRTRLCIPQSTALAAHHARHDSAIPHSIAMGHILTGWLRILSCNREARLCTSATWNSEQREGPDIRQLHSKLQHQWSHDRDAHLGNAVVTAGSTRNVWWTCDQCPDGHPHEWEAAVGARTQGNNCPFCSNKRPCHHNTLAAKVPSVAAQFSNKNEGSPNDYTVRSGKKLLWQCELGHEWVATVHQRTSQKQGCPACYNHRRSIQKVQQPVLTKSQHPMMQQWDWEQNTKAGLNPSNISCGSARKVHWTCPGCAEGQPHRWQATVNSRFRGSGCPCCAGHKACICKSLQSLAPEVAAQWDHTKNWGTPSDYTASSHAKVWWYNEKRGSFQATILDRTHVRKRQPGSQR